MASTHLKGSITQLERSKAKGKCRKWKLSVSLGRDLYTGKYPQKCKRFTGTYTQAEAALRDFISELESGSVVKKNNWVFSDFRKYFIETREAQGQVSSGTLKREKDKLKSIGHLIDNLQLQDINSYVLDCAYKDLRNGKSRSGKKLSGTYVNDIHKKLSLLFDFAVKKNLIAENPCRNAAPPKIDTKQKRALDADTVHEFLDKLDPTAFEECAVLLCVTLGLRRGEAVGLSWGDINFKDRTVAVMNSYDDDGNLNLPKTKAGIRILPMPDVVYAALRKRKLYQMKTFSKNAKSLCVTNKFGHAYSLNDDVPVICDKYGIRIKPQGLGQWWRKHRDDFGLAGWKLHELRHTFLTMLAIKGVHPSIMRDFAGHSASAITMEIYTHVNMDAKREAMKSVQGIF